MDEQIVNGIKSHAKSAETVATQSNQVNNHNGKTNCTTAATNNKLATADRNNACKTEWVRLNIGGKCFVTTKTTLCKNANSFFFKLLQDDPSVGLTTDKVKYLNNISLVSVL